MRVIMTGGGTGGHIYPAIAIADKITERSNYSKILFVGTQRGLESRLVPQAGYDIEFIDVSGLDRRNLLKDVKVIRKYRKAKKQAKAIIEAFKPDVVIGTGGYVSGPLVSQAASMGIRCFIQEQNAVAGLTNRVLGRHVEKIFLGFEEGGNSFKQKEKLVVSGNPVRDAFYHADRKACRDLLGIPEDCSFVLSFGGSQGSGKINRAMMDVALRFSGRKDVIVCFVTGRTYYEPIRTELEEKGVDLEGNIHVIDYVDEMQNYLPAADLVISRSGALTVSEIALCGVPSILIPSPNVTGDHQTFNARALSDKGGAVLLREDELSGESLGDEVERLLSNPGLLEGMAEQTRKVAPVDAADIIYYGIIK